MNDLKKKLFHAAPVQVAVSLSAKALSRGKGTEGHSLDQTALNAFRKWLSNQEGATVIELGTRRTSNRPSTLRRSWVHSSAKHIASDFEAGDDVDVVADAEQLSQTFAPGSVDAVIACSVFEHIRKPWLAAMEIGKVLRPGGKVYVQTHHTFPLHAYPHDYWRFSREALETLFSPYEGFGDQSSWYDYPASILSAAVPAVAGQQAFLNVSLVATKQL